MRVPRRCSVTTTPRLRSSAMPAETVTGLSPTSAARRRTDGSRCPGARSPAATAASSASTSSAALVARIRYCFRSDIYLYYYS
jgi:hypothetical protein